MWEAQEDGAAVAEAVEALEDLADLLGSVYAWKYDGGWKAVAASACSGDKAEGGWVIAFYIGSQRNSMEGTTQPPAQAH